jgi:hypothetical protein
MKNNTIIRCGIDAMRCICRLFSSAEAAVRHNVVLAKWEQHYDAHPNSYTRQKQYGVLNYLTAAG